MKAKAIIYLNMPEVVGEPRSILDETRQQIYDQLDLKHADVMEVIVEEIPEVVT